MTNFAGVIVHVVEAGTKITDERTGKCEVVSDSGAVGCDGRIMYVTRPMFERLKREIPGAQKW